MALQVVGGGAGQTGGGCQTGKDLFHPGILPTPVREGRKSLVLPCNGGVFLKATTVSGGGCLA